MIPKTRDERRATGMVAIIAAAITLAGCTSATDPEPSTEGRGALLHVDARVAPPAMQSPDRRVPGLRRATAEEVTARFERMNGARDRARLEAGHPAAVDGSPAKLTVSTNHPDRSARP